MLIRQNTSGDLKNFNVLAYFQELLKILYQKYFIIKGSVHEKSSSHVTLHIP